MKLVIQKRKTPIIGLNAIGVRLFFLVFGLFLLGLIFFLIGIDPVTLYLDIIKINFLLLPNTIAKMIPLLTIAIGLAIPFKARVDNIGAEGQYIIGTLAGFGTALTFPNLPSLILIPLMFIIGFIFGALWALPVVLFRARGGFQGADVVVSFLLVFPALYLMEFLVSGPWRDPETGFTYSSLINDAGRIPRLDFDFVIQPFVIPFINTRISSIPFIDIVFPVRWNFSSIHITLFLVLIITGFVYYYLFRIVNGVPKTKISYEITVIGKNPQAGRAAGMSFFKVILFTMIISGGLAGIAGVGEIAGNQLRLTVSSPGFGFTAIAVAYLGGLNPIGIIFSSFLFAALIIGGNAIKLTKGLPGTALDLFSGVILFFVLVAEFFFRYTITLRR